MANHQRKKGAGKLFLVNLARVETIWRILLFLGFGGLFLAISYYFQAMGKRKAEPADGENGPALQGR